jgi:hypothetical protein
VGSAVPHRGGNASSRCSHPTISPRGGVPRRVPDRNLCGRAHLHGPHVHPLEPVTDQGAGLRQRDDLLGRFDDAPAAAPITAPGVGLTRGPVARLWDQIGIGDHHSARQNRLVGPAQRQGMLSSLHGRCRRGQLLVPDPADLGNQSRLELGIGLLQLGL